MHVCVAQGVKLTGGETVNDKVDRRPEPRQTSLPPQGWKKGARFLGERTGTEAGGPGRMLDCLAAALSTHAFELLRFNF